MILFDDAGLSRVKRKLYIIQWLWYNERGNILKLIYVVMSITMKTIISKSIDMKESDICKIQQKSIIKLNMFSDK